MKSVLITLFALGAFQASAADYECTARLFAKDLPNGLSEVTFAAPIDGGSHGGEEKSFTFGEHQISILVDGKWRNLTWYFQGALVAGVVSAGGDVIAGHHAVILYNPKDPDEELALSCGPKS